MRQTFRDTQFNHAVGQQTQTPPTSTVGWRTTGQRNQVRFTRSIKAAWVDPIGEFAVQGSVQPILNSGLAYACNRRHPHIERRANHGISPGWAISAFVSFEQNPCMNMGMGRCAATRGDGLQPRPLCNRQLHLKRFLGHDWPPEHQELLNLVGQHTTTSAIIQVRYDGLLVATGVRSTPLSVPGDCLYLTASGRVQVHDGGLIINTLGEREQTSVITPGRVAGCEKISGQCGLLVSLC